VSDRTHRCHYHCAGCGRHFASLRAFDWHRIGTVKSRTCTAPIDTDRPFVATDGICDLTGDVQPAEIWAV
jgi:hypothetical protein